jgi:hypothetical protein
LTAGGIFLWGCTKTQDTAPETRIFGSPPTINSVALNAGGLGTAVCDYGPTLEGYLCPSVDPSEFPNGFPAVTISVRYTEATFSVSVSDPQSTPAASDILLVSASYKTTAGSKPTEISLVILDDGSSNSFIYKQSGTMPEDCSEGACLCKGADYSLTSNDKVANDNIFTRGFAVISSSIALTAPTGFPVGNTDVARNCIANANKQFPAFVDLGLGGTKPFKVEAVDKEGNLTLWPTQPTITLTQTNFTCSSADVPGGASSCACCILLTTDPTKCHGLPGLVGNDFPNGICNDIL